MMDLKNKVVVITGAARGLGKSLANEFYKQGCHLALIDIDIIGLEKAKSELYNSKQKLTVYQSDVSSEQSIISTRLEILKDHQYIDILINNAGVSISQHFDQIGLTDFKRLFDINFWG